MQPTRNVEPSQHEPAPGEVLGGRWRVTSCLHAGRAWLAADTRMHDRPIILVRSARPLSQPDCEAIEAGTGTVPVDCVEPAGQHLVVLTSAGSIAAAPPLAPLSREERAAAVVRAANDMSWLFNAVEPIHPILTNPFVLASSSPDAGARILILPDLIDRNSDRQEALRVTRAWFADAAALWLWGSQDPAALPPRWAESWDAWEQGVRMRAPEPATSLGAMLAVGTGRRVPVATAASPDASATLAPSYAHRVQATRVAGRRETAMFVSALTLLIWLIFVVWAGASR